MEKRIILTPQYMKQFKCTGDRCEDNCCYGWGINIDHDTYKKYRKVSEPTLKLLLDKYIKRNRLNPSIENYARIDMTGNGCCPFIGEDKLCSIQKNMGINFLSAICKTYPRTTNIVNGIFEKSLTLSCPEAARLVLLNPDTMEFDELEEPTETKNYCVNQIETNNIIFKNSVVEYFWLLRDFSITLIQNRKYSLSDRLIILGLFINKVQEYINNSRIHEIPELIEEYNVSIENGNLKKSLKDIPANFTIQMELMKELNDKRFLFNISKVCGPYLECVMEFLNGIKYTDKAKVEEIGEKYKEAYLNYYEPFMKNHEYMLENLIVNHMFMKLFPISSGDKIFEDYMKLILNYALIKTFLIGVSSYHKELNEELIIRIVYSLCRALEHNNAFLTNSIKLFNSNGYNTLAYMAILIKN